MPSRVVVVLLSIAVVLLVLVFYASSLQTGTGPATLPEIGPGAKGTLGSATVVERPADGGRP